MARHAFLYTTFPDETAAREVARVLVEAQAAACANIFGAMQSIYRYDGKLEEAGEVAVIFKLPEDRREEAAELLRRHHPYDTPVTAFINIAPDEATAAWLIRETRRTAS